ncbi:MAG: hypothetical protein IIC67_02440 [Thaumarchaeota archaeon]|nr:hypothetical protein [Nitrososphaerota archaeon]
MVNDKGTIKKKIKKHIEENGGGFSKWYSGITNDIEERLFKKHKVKNAYIYRNTDSKETAESIEDYLVNELGTKGGSGGGKEDSTYVYSYKIKDYTVEDAD